MTDLEIIRAQLLGIQTRLENVLVHVDTLIAEQAPEPEPEKQPEHPLKKRLGYLGEDDQPEQKGA